MIVVAMQYFETKYTEKIFDPPKGVSGILQGAMITFYGYVGFDV